MAKPFVIMMIISCLNLYAQSTLWITTGVDLAEKSLEKNLLKNSHKLKIQEDLAALEIPAHLILQLSHLAHKDFMRCGGYIVHADEQEAQDFLSNKFISFNSFDYQINQQDLVRQLLPEIAEIQVRTTILDLSQFHNRYYTAKSGIESQNMLYNKWQAMVQAREDIKVERVNHTQWPQPSVVMTIEGSDLKDEIVVIGGHADSISGIFGQSRNRAPGADDNASGVASFTEAIRVLLVNNFKPRRTIQVMAYAAEEVGLRGSADIARQYRQKNKKVVGVMQLDMTNFHGNPNLDMTLVDDFTDKAQNEFIGKLIDEYLQYNWAWTRCGYACSDHASWNKNGFPASAPFESDKNSMNRQIHTPSDTIARSADNASHATKFARLALAYLIEMSL